MGDSGRRITRDHRRHVSEDEARERLSTVIDGFAEHLERVKQAQEQRAQLVVEAHAASDRVMVKVNADGALVDVRFSDDINDLDYDEIAAAVLTAARQAAASAADRVRTLIAPVQQRPATIPNIAELIEDIPELRARVGRS
jgi:DNA-binding protein YbaB